jgi:hypothetical protein
MAAQPMRGKTSKHQTVTVKKTENRNSRVQANEESEQNKTKSSRARSALARFEHKKAKNKPPFWFNCVQISNQVSVLTPRYV